MTKLVIYGFFLPYLSAIYGTKPEEIAKPMKYIDPIKLISPYFSHVRLSLESSTQL